MNTCGGTASASRPELPVKFDGESLGFGVGREGIDPALGQTLQIGTVPVCVGQICSEDIKKLEIDAWRSGTEKFSK